MAFDLTTLTRLDYHRLLAYELGMNTVQAYLYALAIFVGTLIILRIFKFFGIKRLKKLAEKTKTELDDIAIKFLDMLHWPFYVIIALYISLRFLNLPPAVDRFMHYTVTILITFYVVWGIQRLIKHFTKKFIQKRQKKGNGVDESAAYLLSKMITFVIWIIAVLFILSNLGYDITTLVAGLGIGGIAIGFALQNILGDIFASFSIYLDKPFQIGDFIIIGNDMGVVKKIGIKSTRITTLQGQELVVSNKELTETRVNNYKKMQRRRIVFAFGVAYETPQKKLKAIPSMVRQILDKIDLADLDRAHFKEFGASSLNFEVVYYLNSSEYNIYMDTQQAINLALKDRFEKEKIEFAYPTQTIYLNKG